MVVLVVVLVGHQRRGLSSPAWPAASVAKPPPKQEPAAAGSSSLFFFLCCCFCGCRLRKQRRGLSWRGLSSPAWPAASVAKPPPQRSCSSDYLSLSFALSIISLSMKALLLECSCKILLADELILNVIVCVRPVAGLPVANRDPGVIFFLSIFIFLVRLSNDARPWAGCRLFFATAGSATGRARNYSSTSTMLSRLRYCCILLLVFEINDAKPKLATLMPALYERK